MFYSSIRPSAPIEARHAYRQGGSLGFVLALSLVALLLGLSTLV
jgi:hypothetical protein